MVAMEVSTCSLPEGRSVLCGIADAVTLFEDRLVTCEAVPEGTFFSPCEPVLRLTCWTPPPRAGLTETDVSRMRDIVDGFGVGGAIARAPVVDDSLDTVEIAGVPVSKRGRWSGAKEVCLLLDGRHIVIPRTTPAPGGVLPLMGTYIDGGSVVKRHDTAALREWVRDQREQESDKHFED